MTDDAAVAHTIPGFSLRWRGYDCDEVDRFVRGMTLDRRRLDDAFARLDALIASKQDGRVDGIVAKAHRDADEIRTAAEQEARRIIRDAENQGEFLQCERLKASRHEIERLETVRTDIEACLETALVALTRARAASTLGAGERPSIATAQSPGDDTKQAAAADGDATKDRRTSLRTFLIVLWGGLSLGIVALLAMPASSGRATGNVVAAAPVQPLAQHIEPVQAAPSRLEPTTANPATPALSRLRVTVVATRECWISTVVDDGEARERLLQPSEKLVLDAGESVVLKAGNAAAVSLLINDQPAAPLGTEGQVITRRITLGNFRTLLAPEFSRS